MRYRHFGVTTMVADWKTLGTSTEILQLRKSRLYEAKDILDLAGDKSLTADEERQYNALFNDAAEMRVVAERMDASADRRKKLDLQIEDLSKSQGRITSPAMPMLNNDGASASNAPYEFLHSRPGHTPHKISYAHGTPEWRRHQPAYRQAVAHWLQTGQVSAALQTDLSTQGGYMVLPEQFVSELLMDVDNIRWMRKLCRTFTTNAQTLGAVKRTTRMSSFAWGSELTAPTADTALAYGKRTLTPHYMTGSILASRDLLRSAILPVEQYIRYEIGRDSGYLEENAFLTGSGAGQPLGIFTATSDGIDTGRDFSTGNQTTAIGADNLRYVKYQLKGQYRSDASLRWLFHRDAINQISRLKDGMGQYLWRDGITLGDPDSILGIAVVESEFAPNTFTTGLYVGMLGAFNFYWIADSLEMDMQVLYELYAATNQIGYLARRKTDGMPQIAEAFARVKLA